MTAPNVEKLTELIAAHQWKGYTKDGAFKCKAGCVETIDNAPHITTRTVTSTLEAQHQADMVVVAFFGGECSTESGAARNEG